MAPLRSCAASGGRKQQRFHHLAPPEPQDLNHLQFFHRRPSLLRPKPICGYDGEGQKAGLGSLLKESRQHHPRVELSKLCSEDLKPETGSKSEGADPIPLCRCRWRRRTALHSSIRKLLDKTPLKDRLDLLESIAAQRVKETRQNCERPPTAPLLPALTPQALQPPHIDEDSENIPREPDAPPANAVADQCPDLSAVRTFRRHVYRRIPLTLRVTIDIEPEVIYDYT